MIKTIECPDCGDPICSIRNGDLLDINGEYVESITECPNCQYADPSWSDPDFKWT